MFFFFENNLPERTRTVLEALTGRPSFNQVMAGRGMPEASQLRATGFFTTTLTFSGTFTWPTILGGTGERGKTQWGRKTVKDLDSDLIL